MTCSVLLGSPYMVSQRGYRFAYGEADIPKSTPQAAS
jgi:hypothetical protein